MKTIGENYLKQRLYNIWTTPELRKNAEKNLSEENSEKILSLKDKHKNQRCFIIGGSPSIHELDLSKLDNEIKFTVNRGYKLFSGLLKDTTYHVVQDKLLFMEDDITDEIPLDKMENLILYAGIDFKRNHEKVVFYNYMHMMNFTETKFEPDLTKMLVEGYSVIYTCMQIACYMGFSEIYIIGVDLDFKNIKGHSYESTEGEKRRGEKSILNQQKMYDFIDYGVKFLQEKGIKVCNASPAGHLDCMDRIKFEDIFNA